MNVDWSQWGFAAAVTGFLLVGSGVLIKWLLSFVDRLAAEQRSERNEWAERHRGERSEWRSDISKVAVDHDERLDKVCETLTMAIKELGRADRESEDG